MIDKSFSSVIDTEKWKKIIQAKEFCDYLSQHGIEYDLVIKHREVLGCDESIKYYQRFSDYLGEYKVCKNLLVRERKGDKRTFLIITDSQKKVDLSSIRDVLDCRKLEFVSEDDMKKILNTTPGNVSLFNMISDKDHCVNLVMDQDLFSGCDLVFHPLYNGMSMFIKPSDVFKFIKLIDRCVNIIPILEKVEDMSYQKKKVI